MKTNITAGEALDIQLALLNKIRSERDFHSALAGTERETADVLRDSARKNVSRYVEIYRKMEMVMAF